MSQLRPVLGSSVLALLVVGAVGARATQDPVATNPGKYKVVFENTQVRLLEFQDRPGDVTVMHFHPPRLVYSLTPWKKRFRFPDDRVVVMEGKAGDATWAEAGSHAGENIGSTDTHILIFELKAAAAR